MSTTTEEFLAAIRRGNYLLYYDWINTQIKEQGLTDGDAEKLIFTLAQFLKNASLTSDDIRKISYYYKVHVFFEHYLEDNSLDQLALNQKKYYLLTMASIWAVLSIYIDNKILLSAKQSVAVIAFDFKTFIGEANINVIVVPKTIEELLLQQFNVFFYGSELSAWLQRQLKTDSGNQQLIFYNEKFKSCFNLFLDLGFPIESYPNQLRNLQHAVGELNAILPSIKGELVNNQNRLEPNDLILRFQRQWQAWVKMTDIESLSAKTSVVVAAGYSWAFRFFVGVVDSASRSAGSFTNFWNK